MIKIFLILTFGFLIQLSALAGDTFSQYQWGFANQGVPQFIDLDPMNIYKLSARNNEDIRIPLPLQWPSPLLPRKVIVAVLDTGIQHDHPDLINKVHRKPSECAALYKYLKCHNDVEEIFNQCKINVDDTYSTCLKTKKETECDADAKSSNAACSSSRKEEHKNCDTLWFNKNNSEVDMDGNGYPMDCSGWSLLGGKNPLNIVGKPNFEDNLGHGTHVAGIIAAEANNDIGIKSIGDNIEILPVQILSEAPNEPVKPMSILDQITENENPQPGEHKLGGCAESLSDCVTRGIIYAVRNGAEVINLSLGWPQVFDTPSLRQAIKEAQDKGVIIIAAAGNDSTRALLRPCVYNNVICVTSHSPDGSISNFSNYGSGVDLAAPGVNILSTYPEFIRPRRFRPMHGYEYVSGSSQAAPFVTSIVAEMISYGVQKNEIYPRLILGARSPQESLPVLLGPSQNVKNIGAVNPPYKKFIFGGNVDLTNALNVQPQALIVPLNKESIEISWDRKTQHLQWEVELINKWTPIKTADVDLHFQFEKPFPEALRPTVLEVSSAANYNEVWSTNEIRKYIVTFSIFNQAPSELELSLIVKTKENIYTIILEADIVSTINEDSIDGAFVYNINGLPKGRFSVIPIDDIYDQQTDKKDYFITIQKKSKWQIWVSSQESTDGDYITHGPLNFSLDAENINNVREQFLIREDINLDGESEYIYGLTEDFSDMNKMPLVTFFIMDKHAKLIDTFKYNGERAPIPNQSNQVYWHFINGIKRPAWIGYGKSTANKVKSIWDDKNAEDSPKQRLYYLDEKNKLQSVQKYNDYIVNEILIPNMQQQRMGRLPVMLIKNKGTELKPSYLYDFATAEIYNGKIENFKPFSLFPNPLSYRNLLETNIDNVQNLDLTLEKYAGNYWFGSGALKQQRLTLFNSLQNTILDQQLISQWKYMDAALWVHSVFSGNHHSGAFVFTNTEIQYHNILSSSIGNRSLEKYSMFPSRMMNSLYFPVTVKSLNGTRWPAIFTAENAELSRGIKILTPVLSHDGKVQEIIAPARLRMKMGRGCRRLDSMTFLGNQGGYALDYLCGNKILRIPLSID